MEWEYVKGSEADFKGAPEWCTHVSCINSSFAWEESSRSIPGNRYQWEHEEHVLNYGKTADVELNIIAERRKVDSMQSCVIDAILQQHIHIGSGVSAGVHSGPKYDTAVTAFNKYARQCKGVTIDVYDVINAWGVTNPALQHLIKKALQAGQRGHKDLSEDLHDILASAKRAIELEEQAR